VLVRIVGGRGALLELTVDGFTEEVATSAKKLTRVSERSARKRQPASISSSTLERSPALIEHLRSKPSPCRHAYHQAVSLYKHYDFTHTFPKPTMPSYEESYGQEAANAAGTGDGAVQSPSSQKPPGLPPAALDLAARLFDLARNGDTPTLLQYITAGIPKNLTNASGDTLLMLAAYHGNAETAKMLLENGADANVLNGRGQSPIAGAVFKGYDDVVRVLYEGGADIQAGQPNAMDCARMFKRGNVLKLFGVEEGEGRTVAVDGDASVVS
jgi:hypothetical protein